MRTQRTGRCDRPVTCHVLVICRMRNGMIEEAYTEMRRTIAADDLELTWRVSSHMKGSGV